MSRGSLILIVCLVILTLLAGAITYRIASEGRGSEPSVAASALESGDTTGTYTDLAGEPVALDTYVGEVLVVTTWASWCPQCRDSLRAADTAAAVLADRGVPVLALNRKEPRDRIEGYLRELPEFEELTVVVDTEDRFYTRTDGYAMPETIIFDDSGEVHRHLRGTFDTNTVVTAVEELMAN